MANQEKKLAAALAAVNAYLQMEEDETAARQALIKAPSAPPTRQSYWSQSGRQEMMTLRRLIQMRTFRSFP